MFAKIIKTFQAHLGASFYCSLFFAVSRFRRNDDNKPSGAVVQESFIDHLGLFPSKSITNSTPKADRLCMAVLNLKLLREYQ
ncbi:MAG: hypothetical protein K9K75_03595 [Deltaproteobacteria bacterium]|nr:hypothetical protein [Deltaproteobacteria bacterium]